MDAYEHDSSLIKIGQKVDIEFTAYPGEKWTANIDFISPVLDESSRTLKIRTTLDNSNGKLKPGMVGDAIINTEPGDIVLVIPTSAVIDTGKRQIVWLQKGENSYMAIDIQTGIKGEGFTEVKSGLKEEDLVVVDGNFLLDAQSQLSGGNMVHNH
jgi:RND family efflux transporter MFP subunit